LLRLLAALGAATALATGCSGDDDDAPAAPAGSVTPVTTVTTVHVTPGQPSELSRMVCEEETVRAGVELYTGEALTAPPVATWVDRTYSCPYLLPDGTLTLSVKELDDLPATQTYFDDLRTELGEVGRIYLGQEGFQAPNGSVVVRKDNLVLLVDASQLADHPAPRTPAEVAVNMAVVIMDCWV
jgi:hypothetical protein